MPPEPSEDIVARAKAGSPEALNLVYERCAGRLLALIRLRLGPGLRARVESRDILQAALMKSVRHLRDFQGRDTRALMGWLARIAENEIRDCADHHHRARRDAGRETPLDADAPIPAVTHSALSRVILGEEAQRIEQALESLSEVHREIILLRKYEELTFGEIARRLGKSEDACRMLLARAMAALTLRLSEVPR